MMPEDEIDRLRRQLDKAVETLDSASICPGDVGLIDNCSRACESCWREALEAVE